MPAKRFVPGVLLAAIGSLVLLSTLLWTDLARADGTGADWSIVSEPEFTTHVTKPLTPHLPAAPLGTYEFEAKNHFQKPAWRLRIRMPRHNPPAGRVEVTIGRTYTEKLEGDHIVMTYYADPHESEASPAPTLAIFVECTIEDVESGMPESSGWARIGLLKVEPAKGPNVERFRANITGKGCKKTVELGDGRVITGARIQLRGADEKHDHQARTVYLQSFNLLNGAENEPHTLDKFTLEK